MPLGIALVALAWFWQVRRLTRVEDAWRAARGAAGLEMPPARSAALPIVAVTSGWKAERLVGESTGIAKVDDLAHRYRQMRTRLILTGIFGLLPALLVAGLVNAFFAPYFGGIAEDPTLMRNGLLVALAIGAVAVLRKVQSVYEAIVVLALAAWWIATVATQP
jgi:hypothetical protein